jgi:cobalt-zinc-cadmium efflux system protein
MGTSHIALTAQLVMPHGHAGDAFLQDATRQMHYQFEITHVTLQVVKAPFTDSCGSVFGPDGNHEHAH